MPSHSYVLGIDIGTSGVKALALRNDGIVIAQGNAVLPAPIAVENRREQNAELWWSATVSAIQNTLRELLASGGDSKAIRAIAVDGTSGTIVPVDADLRPLRPGMMYNDARAGEQAERLNETGGQILMRLGYRFNASFSLAKVLWLNENEPDVMDCAACVIHQTDLITCRLSEASPSLSRCLSDESNALKTGYDILERCWPDYLAREGIDASKLPAVHPIGETIGTIGPKMANEFGFSTACRIVGGMTDGTAACAASGARRVGDMNTTLGTTVVWKMLSSSLICDPDGRLYSHRHPGGGFLPGGAGNAGGSGIRAFIQAEPMDMDEHMDRLAQSTATGPPTGSITYPLPSPGERFPFVDPAFEPFTTADTGEEVILYRSCLEGIACIERWGYEIGAQLGAECDGQVWTTGKGAYLDAWMQIRADILNRPVCRAAYPESAFGSALVAAMNAWYGGSWKETADQLIREAYRREPSAEHRRACDEHYGHFREACAKRRSRKNQTA
jgi:sugar (pentulose or hexulose) kinase